MSIHIVEDDFGVRDALRELLSGLGHDVLAHPDAEAFMGAGPPRPGDVVFVDLGLPGMAGIDVIRWLRALDRPPRIIAISGRPRSDIDLLMRDLPDLPLLRKPIAAESIADLL